MAFITDDDYSVQLRNEISNVIDPTQEKAKLRKAEKMAIAQIKKYLAGRYDIDQIFVDAPTEDEEDTRDEFIVMITIDIALYHLWSKEGANNIPKTRNDRYVDCLDWLKDVKKGEPCDLPLIPNEDGSTSSDIRIWSRNEPENNRF